MDKGVLKSSWSFAELDALAGRCTGGSRSVGIGELHALTGQFLEVRSLVEVTGGVWVAIHHANGGVGPAQIIDVEDDEVGAGGELGEAEDAEKERGEEFHAG